MAKEHREIRRMEIEPAENGGHTVTHNYKERPRHSSKMGVMSGYEEPEHYAFGPEQGHEMLAHIANHLSIPEGKEKDEPEREEEEKEAEE